MNNSILITFKTIFTLIIVWFIGYFVFGEYISLEFSDYNFAQKFPKILTFATGASIYFLILLSIKKSEKWNYINILKFISALILATVPFVLFKYYSSVGICQNWEVTKRVKSNLYQSASSSSETIKSIEIYCLEMEKREEKVYRVMAISPLFNTVYPIDTLKINKNNWIKLK